MRCQADDIQPTEDHAEDPQRSLVEKRRKKSKLAYEARLAKDALKKKGKRLILPPDIFHSSAAVEDGLPNLCAKYATFPVAGNRAWKIPHVCGGCRYCLDDKAMAHLHGLAAGLDATEPEWVFVRIYDLRPYTEDQPDARFLQSKNQEFIQPDWDVDLGEETLTLPNRLTLVNAPALQNLRKRINARHTRHKAGGALYVIASPPFIPAWLLAGSDAAGLTALAQSWPVAIELSEIPPSREEVSQPLPAAQFRLDLDDVLMFVRHLLHTQWTTLHGPGRSARPLSIIGTWKAIADKQTKSVKSLLCFSSLSNTKAVSEIMWSVLNGEEYDCESVQAAKQMVSLADGAANTQAKATYQADLEIYLAVFNQYCAAREVERLVREAAQTDVSLVVDSERVASCVSQYWQAEVLSAREAAQTALQRLGIAADLPLWSEVPKNECGS